MFQLHMPCSAKKHVRQFDHSISMPSSLPSPHILQQDMSPRALRVSVGRVVLSTTNLRFGGEPQSYRTSLQVHALWMTVCWTAGFRGACGLGPLYVWACRSEGTRDLNCIEIKSAHAAEPHGVWIRSSEKSRAWSASAWSPRCNVTSNSMRTMADLA